MYGIEVCGACPAYIFNKLQATQTRLLKILLHVRRCESAIDMYKKYNILNCRQIYELNLLTFVYKQQNKLLPAIFNNVYACNIDRGIRQTRQSNLLYIDKYRTAQGQKTLKCVGAKKWNVCLNVLDYAQANNYLNPHVKHIFPRDVNIYNKEELLFKFCKPCYYHVV